MLSNDRKLSNVCSEILETGTFAQPLKQLPIEKSAFLLDSLEIGKRKYSNIRKLCKTEGIIFPTYKKVASFRSDISLSNRIKLIECDGQTIGAGYSYFEIIKHTTERILKMFTVDPSQYPIELEIADGLDGSGSHRIYNQISNNPNFTTKNFLLFAFKVLSIKDRNSATLWCNYLPNSPFSTRPVSLLAKNESIETVEFLMKEFINPPTMQLEKDGMELSGGHCIVKVRRTMFDGKMSKILSGAGGASCQLCTVTHVQLKDLELIRSGFPINRQIQDAIALFNDFDQEEFLKLDSNSRFGLTHPPTSTIDIIPASPLHSYLCVFRWFMLIIYHLDAGSHKWSPTSPLIQTSMKRVRALLTEKTGYQIDLPSCDGGTTTTGNVARDCFSDKRDFFKWATSTISEKDRELVQIIHQNLSAILRVFNSSHKIDTTQLSILCNDTYEFIVVNFHWANITPSLHKLLAHSAELIEKYNNGFGLKNFSEEGLEALNKYVRKFREHLARKFSFEMNIKDILVRLTTQSDPILVNHRLSIISKKKHDENLSHQDLIVDKLILCREDLQGCKDCML